MSLVALYEPVIRSPVHARRLFWQVIAGVWIIRVQTADDFEHRPRSPIRLRFPLRTVSQSMTAPACNPPVSIEDTTTSIAAWAAKPKAAAAELRLRLLEVYLRSNNLAVLAVTFDLQPKAGR